MAEAEKRRRGKDAYKDVNLCFSSAATSGAFVCLGFWSC